MPGIKVVAVAFIALHNGTRVLTGVCAQEHQRVILHMQSLHILREGWWPNTHLAKRCSGRSFQVSIGEGRVHDRPVLC
jgi:hypothetical protein